MIHELKIKPEYFAAVVSGDKTFEIRNNADRNFKVGDTLLLWEWDGGFTGQTAERTVSYITDFEQKPGYVVLGLANKREQELAEQLAGATRQGDGQLAVLLADLRSHIGHTHPTTMKEYHHGCDMLGMLDATLIKLGGCQCPRCQEWWLDGTTAEFIFWHGHCGQCELDEMRGGDDE